MTLPSYIRECNYDQEFREKLVLKFKYSNGPRVLNNLHRIAGQVFFGAFYRCLINYAIPWEYYIMNYASLILPLGTAFGTYMVSNVGHQKSSFTRSLISAYIGEFLFGESHIVFQRSHPLLIVALTTVFSTYGWEWRKNREQTSYRKCLITVFVVYCLFIGLCSSFVYFNAKVKTDNGEIIKGREALEKYLTSQIDIYQPWKTDYYDQFVTECVHLDVLEQRICAYRVLGPENGTRFEEVRKRYKTVLGEWNPENDQEEEDVKVCLQQEFMQYSTAYKILEEIQQREMCKTVYERPN